MNEEVKEILDNIDIWYKENDLDYSRWFGLEELKQLKDYITNLQYKYENQIHRYINLKEYTTNLQEENEFLKLNNPEMNIEHFRIVKENKRKIDNLRKKNENLEKLNNANYLSFIDVNKKRLKAIEFIKEKISSTQGVINDYMYHKEHNKRLIELLQEDIEMYKKELHILNGGDE